MRSFMTLWVAIAEPTVSTTRVGQAAEQAVAEELVRQGFRILERNWKTKWCEVDIIASKNCSVWFVEVKYRTTTHFGDGLEYIGPQKIRHLHLATSLWTNMHDYDGEITIAGIAVSKADGIGELVEL